MNTKFKGLARGDLKKGREDKGLEEAWTHGDLIAVFIKKLEDYILISILFVGGQLFGNINSIGTNI